MKITLEQRKENNNALNSIFSKCRNDSESKAKFITNPKSFLEKEMGSNVKLNEGKNKIVVEDQSDPSIIYLNIIANEELNIELTEEELEVVSGGAACAGICIGIIFAVCAIASFFATKE